MGTLNCCLRSRLADLVIRLFSRGRRMPLASRWNMRRTCPRQVGSRILLHLLSLADNTPSRTRSPTTRGSIACRNRSLESGEKEIVASCAVITPHLVRGAQPPATEWRKRVAHGASRGEKFALVNSPRQGRQNDRTSGQENFLSPLRGSNTNLSSAGRTG